MSDSLESLSQLPHEDSTRDPRSRKYGVDSASLVQCPTCIRQCSSSSQFDSANSSPVAHNALPVHKAADSVPDLPKDTSDSFIHRNLGLFLIATAQIFFSTMNLCAKLLSMEDQPIHPLEVMFVRMLITWLVLVLYLHYNKVPDYLIGPKGVRLLLVVRGFIGFFGLFGIYYSLQYLDLSDATVLTFLSPILTCYFGKIFLKEPVHGTEVYAGFLSLLGVILIARPQSLFGTSNPMNAGTATGLQRLVAIIVALIGVIATSGAYISIRAIGSRVHPLMPVSMFALCTALVSGIGLAVLHDPFVIPHTFLGWAAWIALGICGFVAQFLVTSGLQKERAGRGVSMVYLQMVFAFVFERFVWGILPDIWSMSGSGLILGGAIWVAVAKSRIKQEHRDDIERAYITLNTEEKENDFELGESDDDEDEKMESISDSLYSPSQEKHIGDT